MVQLLARSEVASSSNGLKHVPVPWNERLKWEYDKQQKIVHFSVYSLCTPIFRLILSHKLGFLGNEKKNRYRVSRFEISIKLCPGTIQQSMGVTSISSPPFPPPCSGNMRKFGNVALGKPAYNTGYFRVREIQWRRSRFDWRNRWRVRRTQNPEKRVI